MGRLGLLEGGVRVARGMFVRWRRHRRAARDSAYFAGLWLLLHTRVMLVQAESRMRTRESEQATDPLLQR